MKGWVRIRSIIGLLVVSAVTARGAGLEMMLDPAGVMLGSTAEEFMKAHAGDGFRWLSATNRDAARAANAGLTFLGMRAWESVARFEGGTLKDLTVSLYNRGDAGEMEEAAFQKFMQDVDEHLSAWAKVKGVTLRSQERTNIAAVRRKAWIKEPYRVDLVWSFSEKSRRQGLSETRPEYARLEISRFDPQQDPRKSALVGTGAAPKLITALELRGRVKRSPNGDVVIPTVPMVDQGQKGYCAAAVAERVLRYYGRDVDQHEIAQLANTSAGGGTTPQEMVTALRRIADEMRVDVTVLTDFDVREFEKTMTDYNRAAKRARKPEIDYMHRQGNTIMLESPTMAYREMDTALLKEIRVKRDGPMSEFKATITRYINAGTPLEWGVMVGKVSEVPDPRGMGGHMRLIIGYNDRTGEILYTDTWGAGHELKRLSVADAWTITMGLYCLQPRDVRF